MRLINDVKDKFTIIPNYILQQRNISLKAIGLYSKLSSFPDNWDFTESGLCSLVKDGQDSVRTAIKELEELGLFLRFRKRNKDGTLGETIFYISPIPMTEEKKNEIKSRFELEETLVQPVVEKPILDISILENQTLYNNNIYNNNIYKTNKEKEIYKERFEKFYFSYPRKVGKANVEKWFNKNKPDEELFNKIMTALEEHKKTKQWQDKQFIPHPSTWLNQKRWEDEIEIDSKKMSKYEEEAKNEHW